MSPQIVHPPYGRPDTLPKGQKRLRPNALRNAQVLPPHNVELTLPPAAHEDIHVPADISGADLSRGALAPAAEATKAKMRTR